VGILCVISRDANGREIYNHLVHDLGQTSIDFLLPLQNWDNFDRGLTEHATRFYEEVLEAWIEDNNPSVSIRTLSDPLIAMLSDKGAARRAAGLSSSANAITIRSNGDLCPDDTLTPLSTAFRNTGHNVRTSSLAEFMRHPLWEELRVACEEPNHECNGCRWWSICRGGHPDHRYGSSTAFRRKTTYCDTYKVLYERLGNYVAPVVDPERLDRRLDVFA
jgi:uncharacterized protein